MQHWLSRKLLGDRGCAHTCGSHSLTAPNTATWIRPSACPAAEGLIFAQKLDLPWSLPCSAPSAPRTYCSDLYVFPLPSSAPHSTETTGPAGHELCGGLPASGRLSSLPLSSTETSPCRGCRLQFLRKLLEPGPWAHMLVSDTGCRLDSGH